jgi:photosystem II stability/assembly factor-like uncharacterized protein
MIRRRVLLASLAPLGWGLLGGAAAADRADAAESSEGQLPEVLRSPALRSNKATRSAMLAVARAGPRLVAVGERGIVLLSDDDGASWRQGETPVQVSLTAVQFVDEQTGWAVGHLGVILRTTDGGNRWALQMDGVRAARLHAKALAERGDDRAAAEAARWIAEGPDKPFFDVCFTDARNGLVVGAFNLAFATQDGGATWQSVATRLPNSKNLHLYSVRRQGGTIYMAGEQGLLLKSMDGGRTYKSLVSPYNGSFFGLLVTRAGTLLAFGLRGSVFRSTDAGLNWQSVKSGVTSSITAAATLSGGRVALLSQDGRVFVSTDDGAALRLTATGADAPASGLTTARDGSLVLASLQGTRLLPAP